MRHVAETGINVPMVKQNSITTGGGGVDTGRDEGM